MNEAPPGPRVILGRRLHPVPIVPCHLRQINDYYYTDAFTLLVKTTECSLVVFIDLPKAFPGPRVIRCRRLHPVPVVPCHLRKINKKYYSDAFILHVKTTLCRKFHDLGTFNDLPQVSPGPRVIRCRRLDPVSIVPCHHSFSQPFFGVIPYGHTVVSHRK